MPAQAMPGLPTPSTHIIITPTTQTNLNIGYTVEANGLSVGGWDSRCEHSLEGAYDQISLFLEAFPLKPLQTMP